MMEYKYKGLWKEDNPQEKNIYMVKEITNWYNGYEYDSSEVRTVFSCIESAKSYLRQRLEERPREELIDRCGMKEEEYLKYFSIESMRNDDYRINIDYIDNIDIYLYIEKDIIHTYPDSVFWSGE